MCEFMASCGVAARRPMEGPLAPGMKLWVAAWSASRACHLGQGTAGRRVAVGTEVAEVETRDVADERELVFDHGGLEVLRAHEGQPHARRADAPETVQDVLGCDRARDVGHRGADKGLE